MTQAELGSRTGVDRNTISAYETEKRTPTAMAAIKIAKALFVPLEYLCGISNEKYKIFIPKDVELDLRKLNTEGLNMLCKYYKMLCEQKEYTEETAAN